ncbi:MAG: DUF3194 domain-containing protein, partial [Candidatus Bathyarchaeia archaeon]|jgi:hypothetical protein
LDELGIPELSTEQIETLCQTAEDAARKFVLAKVSSKMIDKLDISVESEGSKPLKVSVEVNVQLTPQAKDVDAEAVVKEATSAAHKAVENFLRKLK